MAPAYSSFVALGDSFTEGLDDPVPGGGYRGWADLVAQQLATAVPGLRYANLAVRGRLLGRIVDEQVPVALELRPDLVSLAGGTNDILRPRCDVPALTARLEDAVARLAAAGSQVLLFEGVEPTGRNPLVRRLASRVTALNAAVRRAAAEHGAVVVRLAGPGEGPGVFADRRVWSEDRLHLNSEGHRRVAAAVLEALGTDRGALAAMDWRAPLPVARPEPWLPARRADLRWARAHLAPWVQRRLTGRSSGDTVTAKRPTLEALPEGAAESGGRHEVRAAPQWAGTGPSTTTGHEEIPHADPSYR